MTESTKNVANWCFSEPPTTNMNTTTTTCGFDLGWGGWGGGACDTFTVEVRRCTTGRLHTLQHVHTHTHSCKPSRESLSAIALLPLFLSLCVCLPPLLLSSFSSSERGQLENILCSFSAQTRDSQGPLIKDNRPPLCLPRSCFLPFFLSAPSAPFIILTSLPLSTLFPSFQWRVPPFTALSRSLSPLNQSSLALWPVCDGGGLIFSLGRSSESICARSPTCFPLLSVLTMT